MEHKNYPEETCTPVKMDEVIQELFECLYPDTDNCEYETSPDEICWENIRHLRIIGSDQDDLFPEYGMGGVAQGFWMNPDRNCMLIVLPADAYPGDFLTRCGKNLQTLQISNWPFDLGTSGIGHLTGLTELSFPAEYIHTLPGLGNLTKLTKLDLHSCSSLTQLPDLGNLTELTSLDLSWCRDLTELPGLEKLTKLSSLDLSFCENLTTVPSLENLTKLTELNLDGCSSLTQLPDLEKLTKLYDLRIIKTNLHASPFAF